MKKYLLTISLLLIFSNLLAQGTNVSGIISGETWTTDGNPYRVTGDINVQSLVIGAGVEIKFMGNFIFRISGILNAHGTAADSILFYNDPSNPTGWQGIHFDTTAVNSSITFCRISDAVYGIRNTQSEIFIANTLINNNSGNGVEIINGTTRIERCVLENNGTHGVFASSGGRALVFNSIIRENIQNGIKTDNCKLEIYNSIIASNSDGGIFLANIADSLLFENCTIADNTGGPGIVLFGGNVTGINSIIYFNALAVGFSRGSVTIDYSDIEDLTSYEGNGDNNFDLAPDFSENMTYTLNGSSPCIDKGHPDIQYNDTCFPPSLGSNRNDVGAYGGPGACLWFDPLVVSPPLLSFGNVSIGDTTTRSILFRNYRDTAFTINSIIISGDDAELFFTQMNGFILSPFDSLRRDIGFSPQIAGNFSASLITNSSAGQHQISLSGRGVEPNISVDPMNLNFGSIKALFSLSADIIINNLGMGTLQINEISIDAEYFTLSTPPSPFFVTPFTSDTISVVFTPDSSGIFSATLSIFSNDPDESMVAIGLSGSGIAPKITLESDSIDCGRVNILSDTLVQFRVSNTGDDTLIVFSGNVIDPDSLFRLDAGEFPFSIPPGGLSRNLDINFNPVSIGDFTGLLQLHSNDPRRDSLDVPLSGTGIAPRIEIAPDSLVFGEVVVNTVKTDSVVFRNTGNADLAVSWMSLENPDGVFSLLDSPNSIVLGPDEEYTIRIAYAPQDTGRSTAVLPVFSNDADRDSIRIPLSGRGIQPILTIAIDTLDFGTVLVFNDTTRSFDILNTGTGGLIIDTAYTADRDTSAFSVVSDFPLVIPAFGSPASLTARFQPPARGLFEDTLYVSSNDPDQILVSVILTGNGSAPIIEIARRSLIFDTTYITESSTDSVMIKNSGEGDLYLTNIIFLNGTSSSYSLGTPVDNLVVPGSDSIFIQINFEPDAGGLLNDSLIIFNTDPTQNRIAVYLEGNAIYDITPAQFQEYSSFDTLQTGHRFVFEAHIQDNQSQIQQVYLDIRNPGEASFERLNLYPEDGNLWSVVIPQERINIRGIEYYLQIFHGGTITNFGTRDEPKKKHVHINDYPLPAQTLANKYQMISLPVNTQNQSLSDLFGDDLGEYDNTEYRFFDWDFVDSAFVELVDMSPTLEPGNAVWLITKGSKTLDLDNALSVLADSSYAISLTAGWNMFGNPFAFDVAWNNMSDSLIQGGTAYYYDGIEWIFNVERLEPFKGYAVYATAPVLLQVPQQEAPPLTKSVAVTDEWHIRIEGRSGSYRDTYNFAGVRAGSENGLDLFDVYNPPSLTQDVSVVLDQGLAADYRRPDQNSYQFEFTFISTHDRNTMSIVPWNLPEDLDWTVVSPEARVRYTEKEIRVSNGEHSFMLLVGKKSFLEKQLEHYKDVPQTYLLSQNFPNPFNPDTKISFQLPHSSRVTIEVYNLLGQKLLSLLNGEIREAGYHEVAWNGRDASGRPAASGLYFLHFYTADYRKTIKMILQR